MLTGSELTPPSPAAAKGYNRLAFYDDFDSIDTIDMGATKAPGFKWYRTFNWPNLISWLNGNIQNSAANISVANSVLTLDGIAGAGLSLSSADYIASGSNFVGYCLDPILGYYFEINMAWDDSLSPAGCNFFDGTCGWPVIWSFPKNFCAGGSTLNVFEIDYFEAIPISGVSTKILTLHDWPNANASNAANNTNTNNNVMSAFSSVNVSQFHTYGTRLTPMAANGGVGLIERYLDGTKISGADVFYTTSGPASPGATPNNPNGTFAQAESGLYPIFLGGGYPNWPLQIDFIKVWGKSMLKLVGFPNQLVVGQSFQVSVIDDDDAAPVPPAPVGESPNNTRVPPSSSIRDAQNHVWTLGASVGAGNYQIVMDGSVTTGIADLLVYCQTNGLHVRNYGQHWYRYDGGAWTPTTNPGNC